MKVLAVTSRSLLDTKWIDLSIRVFSPREFLCGLFGIISLIAVLSGKIHPVAALFGVILLIFGFIPFGFITPEKQILFFLRFHMKKDSSTKKSKKEESSLIGIGMMVVVSKESKQDDNIIPTEKTDSIEIVKIEDLDIPYTLKLKTSAQKQFVPVLILFSDVSNSDEIPVARTTTGRKGKVSCTILLEGYGQKRVRVTGGEDGEIFYDKIVEFQRK